MTDIGKIARLFRAPKGVLAAFVHQIRLIDREQGDVFVEHLMSGEGLTNGDPILALRTWLINMATRKDHSSRPAPRVYLAVLIKAWNCWILGQERRVLAWKGNEELPRLVDPYGNAVDVRDEIGTDLAKVA